MLAEQKNPAQHHKPLTVGTHVRRSLGVGGTYSFYWDRVTTFRPTYPLCWDSLANSLDLKSRIVTEIDEKGGGGTPLSLAPTPEYLAPLSSWIVFTPRNLFPFRFISFALHPALSPVLSQRSLETGRGDGSAIMAVDLGSHLGETRLPGCPLVGFSQNRLSMREQAPARAKRRQAAALQSGLPRPAEAGSGQVLAALEGTAHDDTSR